VILCDHHIQKAISKRQLIIKPTPGPNQYDSSALNLRVGNDFHIWKPELKARGTDHVIDLDNIDLADLIGLTDRLKPNAQGLVIIEPGAFVLVRTLEYVRLPTAGKLAARVEGRSKQARLGMSVHITAPTIHAGFAGRITLEIVNHGPFQLKVRPNKSMLCQLIVEMVSDVPQRGGSRAFTNQQTPLGTRKPPRSAG
jgi:dCTP deaminase